jgi:tetrahydromethanopterin:alpha-L-glutamate ligase
MSAMQIPILIDAPEKHGGWHGAQLTTALAAHKVEAVFVSLQDCVINCAGYKPVIQIPGFKTLPKAVFVRSVAGGTLQQITTRLNVLHILKMLNVLVYNDAKAIERTVDKAMTSFLLHQNGILTPKTWVCESRQNAHAIIVHEVVQNNQPLVIKPLFGSQGTGVRLVNINQLPLPMDAYVDGVFYLQAFIKAKHDYRIFVVNNKAIAGMQRQGENWQHNAALGAQLKSFKDAKMFALAEMAAKTLDIAYCGVDIICDENGKLYVLEVNSIPAWRGLQTVTMFNIAQALVDDFMTQLFDQSLT